MPGDQIEKVEYDSTENFIIENLEMYIGQELCFIPNLSISNYIVPTLYMSIEESQLESKGNIYHPEQIGLNTIDLYRSNIRELYGRYFSVLDVVEKECLTQPKYYLKLLDHSSDIAVYFEIPSTRSKFPFLILGYYEKLKSRITKKTLVANMFSVVRDLSNNRDLTVHEHTKWLCSKISISKVDSRLIYEIQNQNGDKFGISKKEFDKVFLSSEDVHKSKIQDPQVSEIGFYSSKSLDENGKMNFGRRIVSRNTIGVLNKLFDCGYSPNKGKVVVDVVVNPQGAITSCSINVNETDCKIPLDILESILTEFQLYRFDPIGAEGDLEKSKILFRFSDF